MLRKKNRRDFTLCKAAVLTALLVVVGLVDKDALPHNRAAAFNTQVETITPATLTVIEKDCDHMDKGVDL